MSLINDVQRSAGQVRAALTDPKPLHALAGLGDTAVARLRSTSVDVAGAQHALTTLPARAQAVAGRTADRASATYDALADRGRSLVTRIRKQRASRDLADQAETTIRSAKAATTAAQSAADAATSRVRATVTSAWRTATAAGIAVQDAVDKTGTASGRSTGRTAKATTRRQPSSARTTRSTPRTRSSSTTRSGR